MFKKVLFFLLISNCWWLLWCRPTRDIPESINIVRDERQKGNVDHGANIHVKFDGLVVAVSEPTTLINIDGVTSSLFNTVLEYVFGRMHRPDLEVPSPVANIQYLQSLGSVNHTQQTGSEKIPETTTSSIPTSTDKIAPLAADAIAPSSADTIAPTSAVSSSEDKVAPSSADTIASTSAASSSEDTIVPSSADTIAPTIAASSSEDTIAPSSASANEDILAL